MKSSELTYNAALNRPAYEISVHTNIHGTYPPKLANDGSRHTTYNTGTKCAISDKHTNPWWAVDLGRPTTVYRVYFTNVDHSSGGISIATIPWFLLRDAMHERGLCRRAVSVCIVLCCYHCWHCINWLSFLSYVICNKVIGNGTMYWSHTSSYSPSVVTMAVSLAILEIFSLREWPDLEVWIWGRSR